MKAVTHSLRARLIFLVLLAVIPSLGLALYSGLEQRRMVESQSHEDAVRTARLARSRQQELIREAQSLLRTIVQSPAMRNRDQRQCADELTYSLRQHPQFLNIGVADVTGAVWCSALPHDPSISVADRAYFQRVLQTRSFAVGDYQVGRITGKPSLNFGHPVFDETGELTGVVFVALDLDWINTVFQDSSLPEGSTVAVIDADGTILMHNLSPETWVGRNMRQHPLIAEILTNQDGTTVKQVGLDGQGRLHAYVPLAKAMKGGHVFFCVGIPLDAALARSNKILTRNLLLIATVGLIALFMARSGANVLLLEPMDKILQASRQLAAGNLNVRVDTTGNVGEWTKLATAFNEMAEALNKRASEKAKAESALQENEERFRCLSASSPVGIFLTDVEGQCTYVNPMWRRIYGLTLMESVGEGWMRVVHPDDQATAVSAWREAVKKAVTFSQELRIVRADGATRWIHVRAAVMVADDGAGVGHVGTAEDITERKQAIEALREGEERYRSLVENARDAIFTLSPHGILLSLNPAFTGITGWPREEWLNKAFAPLIHVEDMVRALMNVTAVLRGETPPPFELRKDGSYVVGEFTVTPQFRAGKVVSVLGIGRDVTERRRLEEQFRQSQKMEAVGRLAGGVAHDFNNILTAILGYSEILLSRGQLDELTSRRVGEIHRSAQRAAALTRQLLAFSRKQVMELKVVDINSIVRDMQQMLSRLIGEDIRLVMDLAANLGSVKADPGQIEQVLLNLCVNARDAMPHGGALTIATLNVEFDEANPSPSPDLPDGAYVCLSVTDNGQGIKPEVLARLFEPFFTTKPAGKGTGLGLATCYGILKQSGGVILCQSEYGRGATFKSYLPRVDAPVTTVATPSEDNTAPPGSETILVVEDEAAVRELTCLVLRDLGYKVFEAGNGLEALKLMEAGSLPRLDLLMTDMVMPELGGRDLADRMAQKQPGIRILFVSGYTQDSLEVKEGGQWGATGFLQKPFVPQTLARKVRAILDGDGVVV
jgi:PAS domain S-box-containing protein